MFNFLFFLRISWFFLKSSDSVFMSVYMYTYLQAYVQQLESSRIKLTQLEQDLQRARSQVITVTFNLM